MITIISVRQNPEYAVKAITYFQQSWPEVAPVIYQDCISNAINAKNNLYPLILQAEKEGKILSSNVAILEDRIAVREGRPQTYGSQGFYDPQTKKNYTYPLTDPENIDTLRKSRGLQPMIEYKKDWSIEDYNTNLAKAEEHLKKIMNTNK